MKYIMKSTDAKFQSYLRREVEIAGKRYDEAVEKVFALTGAPNTQPGSDLLDAIQVVVHTLRLYTGALRELASFAEEATRPSPLQLQAVECSQENLVHA